jgi:hypothetical protein
MNSTFSPSVRTDSNKERAMCGRQLKALKQRSPKSASVLVAVAELSPHHEALQEIKSEAFAYFVRCRIRAQESVAPSDQ